MCGLRFVETESEAMNRSWLCGVLIAAMGIWVVAGTAEAQSRRRSVRSAQPGPRDYKSKNFLVHTDLSPEEANELLGRLETMIRLVSQYFRRPNQQIIECYVIKEPDNWPAGSVDPEGLASVLSGGGVTKGVTLSVGSKFRNKSVVYAGADRGTPQHEAVHAYCAQTFGRTGPTWYSEGMAEVGQYFRDGDTSVHIHAGVLKYLQESEHKTLDEIVNSFEVTGDSWQNYAWRWALCHLLGNNPNYRDRFLPLGLGLLQKRPGYSFNATYGPMAKEIMFEYAFFLDHIEQGYRVDLCAWDWKAKFRKPHRSRASLVKVEAGRGWQPSRALVEEGSEYQFAVTGEWELAKPVDLAAAKPEDSGEEPAKRSASRSRRVTRGRTTKPKRETEAADADGLEGGRGRLVGVIFNDYELSEPFELGVFGTFEPPMSGQLWLRARDDWGDIEHNVGSVSVRIKPADSSSPLKDPRLEGDAK